MCNLWHLPIAPRKPVQSLQSGHRNPRHNRGRYFPRSATARPIGRHHKPAHLSPTRHWLVTNATQGDLLQNDSPVPNSPIRDIVITERDAQLLVDLRRASAIAIPRSIVSQYATVWAESLARALNGHQSWAILCRYSLPITASRSSQWDPTETQN